MKTAGGPASCRSSSVRFHRNMRSNEYLRGEPFFRRPSRTRKSSLFHSLPGNELPGYCHKAPPGPTGPRHAAYSNAYGVVRRWGPLVAQETCLRTPNSKSNCRNCCPLWGPHPVIPASAGMTVVESRNYPAPRGCRQPS